MAGLTQDIHFALRALLARPTHALITIAVLALAIGANTTVFSIYSGLFLRSLPYPDDDRLVVVYNTYPGINLEFAGTSIPDYLDRRDRAPSLEQLAIYTNAAQTLGSGESPERISVVRATPSLFATLGVAPLLGRGFTDEEAQPGRDEVVVLSHTLWSSRYGGRPDIVGRDIFLDSVPRTVVGVMPASFGFPDSNVAAWTPFAWTPEQASDVSRGQEFSSTIGRLRPGATVAALNGELDTIVRENLELGRFVSQTEEGIAQTGFTGRARSLREMRVGEARQVLVMLQFIVLAVLLIACANVTNFQLARMQTRRRELAVRRALGAGLLRTARLVVIESFALAILGGAVGVVLTYGALDLVRSLGLDATNVGFDYVIDASVLAFAGATVLVAALASVVLPLWVLIADDFASAIADGTHRAHGSRARAGLRSTLVVMQVAVSVALLVAGGLLLKSFNDLQRAGTGFSADSVWSGMLVFPAARYPTLESRQRFLTAALEQLGALPGVATAAYTSNLPFGSSNAQGNYAIENYALAPSEPAPHAQQRAVSPGFFDALGMAVIAGRDFRDSEAENVVIVDELFVARYFPDGNVIGRRIREDFGPEDPWYTIVGVVPAIKHASLAEPQDKETLYWHFAQNAPPFGSIVLRTLVPPEGLTPLVSSTVLAIDPLMPVSNVQTLRSRVLESLGPQRAPLVLVLLFALCAYSLAMVGVYGILTWSVTNRVGEIGVRMALGARAADIVRMVLGQGGRLVAVGLALGLAAAIALGRVLAAQIPELEALDSTVFTVVIVGLLVTALITSWLPARRAARVDPMTALREE